MPHLLAQQQPPAPPDHGEGADAHGGHPTYIGPLDLAAKENMAAAFWSLGIFLVLFFVLWKFAWGPIVKGLQGREDRINESLKRAEELEKATRELTERHREAMAKAQQEAQQVVAEARAQAQKAAADVAEKAHAEIDASRERFQREMALEAAKVKAEIRREAVELTLAAASRVIGKSLSGADHSRLADEALRDAESVARG